MWNGRAGGVEEYSTGLKGIVSNRNIYNEMESQHPPAHYQILFDYHPNVAWNDSSWKYT